MKQPIFSFNDRRNGSYIDPISNTIGENTNGEWKQTEKGFAWFGNGVSSSIDYGIFDVTSLAFIELWIKPFSFGENNAGHIISDTDYFNITLSSSDSNLKFSMNSDEGTVAESGVNSIVLNRWHHVFITYSSGVANIYINGSLSGAADQGASSPFGSISALYVGNRAVGARAFHGFIGKVNIGSGSIERDFLYRKFLMATPISRGNVGTEHFYPKPNDLSYIPGLVAAYNMEPSPGQVLVDISGNGNNGTIHGAISNKEGLKFDGVDDYVDLTDIIFNITTQSYSISTWVRKPAGSSTSWNGFIGSSPTTGGSWMLGHYSDQITYYQDNYNDTLYLWASGLSFGDEMSYDTWEHIVIKSTAVNTTHTNLSVHINGGEFASTILFENSPRPTTTFSITGIGKGHSNRHFNGSIDEVMIFNRALSEQEIKDIYNKHVKTVIKESFEDNPVGEVNPVGWIKGTGEYEVKEKLDGTKYLECTSAGTKAFIYDENTNVTASIDYYDGSNWSTLSDTLANLITDNSWLSLLNNKLTFDLASGEAITNIHIKSGVKK